MSTALHPVNGSPGVAGIVSGIVGHGTAGVAAAHGSARQAAVVTPLPVAVTVTSGASICCPVGSPVVSFEIGPNPLETIRMVWHLVEPG